MALPKNERIEDPKPAERMPPHGGVERAPLPETEAAGAERITPRTESETTHPLPPQKLSPSEPPLVAPLPKDELLLSVEHILEEDLGDAFQKLSPDDQARFKKKGEDIARTIWQMIETAKVHVRKILHMIRDWLKMIPGVNRYFLEQETKIKIDKLIDLAHKDRR